jgi:hypothetical protein
LTKTVTLTNNGPVVLANFVLFVSSGFQIASPNCGSSLEVASSCTAQIAFVPASAGQQTGNLTISSSALVSTLQVPLSGMGFDFTVATSGQSSLTVASGQTASFTVSLTPMSGSSGNFSFGCGSLPANSVCTFNPNSETVPANSSGTVAVQIATGRSASSAKNDAAGEGPFHSRYLPIVWAILALPFVLRGRKRNRFSTFIVFLGLFGLASCAGAGGGNSTAPPNSPKSTPPGTYSIDITATANGVAHKTTLTLTVD